MEFKEAIDAAAKLLQECAEGKTELTEEVLFPFLESETSVRGFFVSFLTSPLPFCDNPPPALLGALRANPDPSYSAIVRNIVMSSSTEASHRLRGDHNNAEGSAKVKNRSSKLVILINDDDLWRQLADMRSTLEGTSKTFEAFLHRIGLAEASESKSAALAAVEQALSLKGTPK